MGFGVGEGNETDFDLIKRLIFSETGLQICIKCTGLDKPFENAKNWHRMIWHYGLKEIIFPMNKIILIHISDVFHFSNILVTLK